MGAKLAQNPHPVHGPGRSLFAGDEQNFAQVRGRFHQPILTLKLTASYASKWSASARPWIFITRPRAQTIPCESSSRKTVTAPNSNGRTILIERERIKRQTIANRRLLHRRQAASHHKPDEPEILLFYFKPLPVPKTLTTDTVNLRSRRAASFGSTDRLDVFCWIKQSQSSAAPSQGARNDSAHGGR
jgi:hypothetical protein